MWRGGFRFDHICSRLFRLAVPYWFDHGSVSTSRSSNRTCRSPASGSRTRPHAFVHGTSCPSLFTIAPPTALSAAIGVAPERWRRTLKDVVILASRHGVVVRIFGSLAWRSLTGLDYRTD